MEQCILNIKRINEIRHTQKYASVLENRSKQKQNKQKHREHNKNESFFFLKITSPYNYFTNSLSHL